MLHSLFHLWGQGLTVSEKSRTAILRVLVSIFKGLRNTYEPLHLPNLAPFGGTSLPLGPADHVF
jgi:hypothetical protein